MGIIHLQLSQGKAKRVAQLLANETSAKIMDSITKDSKPESQISKELKIPLSTVHHNIQQLREAGLVTSDEYTYSEKGKEVRHYKLASEHVVITTNPLATTALLSGLGLSLLVAAIFYLQQPAVEETKMLAARSMDAAEGAMMAAAPVQEAISRPVVWPWILLGAGIMLAGILAVTLLQRFLKRN